MYDLVSFFVAYVLFIIQTTRKPESKSDRDAAGGGVINHYNLFPHNGMVSSQITMGFPHYGDQ